MCWSVVATAWTATPAPTGATIAGLWPTTGIRAKGMTPCFSFLTAAPWADTGWATRGSDGSTALEGGAVTVAAAVVRGGGAIGAAGFERSTAGGVG